VAVIGFPTYLPSPLFAFPRPYVDQVTFHFNAGVTFVQSDNDFVITDGANPNVHVRATFLPEFWATSSNRYTIDHLLVNWWVYVDPSPTPIPIDFTVTYFIDPVTIKPEIFVGVPAATTRYTFPLPPAPPDYWTPIT